MWFYQGQPFSEEMIGDHYGFIYEITDTVTGRAYIGRKFFTMAGYKTVKGKRKKLRKPSDWQTYYGSSPELLAFIAENGKERFHREILRLCKTLGETKYQETKLLFLRNVLEEKVEDGSWKYFNGNIATKYTRRNIGLR